MRRDHAIETLLARVLLGGLAQLSWKQSLAVGARLGDVARLLGVRRRVAERNLALAFPERTADERAAILVNHYRELGRVLAEYPRIAELIRLPGAVLVRGLDHLIRAREAGRGAILMSGHYGNFELLGAYLGRSHPVDFVVQPLSNPGVEAMLDRNRERAGVGRIPIGTGVRRVYQALRANHWVTMLADQDARAAGAFVPFMGRPSSTATGPARVALATGAPLIMGFATRRPDGGYELEIEPPLTVGDPEAPDAAVRLTAAHAARLEHWVRRRPEMWYWLHRRWKTVPPLGEQASRRAVGVA